MPFFTCLVVATAVQRLPLPPPMPVRPIAPRANLPGKQITLKAAGMEFTLFVPDAWKPDGETDLGLHFHGAVWHALQEHVDRGAAEPVAAFALGEGSAVYRAPFVRPEALGEVIDSIESALSSHAAAPQKVGRLSLTSFSAGYGAVREIVQQPWLTRIRRVILSDSLYGSLDPSRPGREVLPAHVDCWKPLRERAIRGDATFCLTVSEVPTPSYASSFEVASALVEGKWQAVEPGTLAATAN